MAAPLLDEPERSARLDAALEPYARAGYRLVARSPTTARLVAPKEVDVVLAIILLLLCVIPGLLYLAYCRATPGPMLTLSVNVIGEVVESRA